MLRTSVLPSFARTLSLFALCSTLAAACDWKPGAGSGAGAAGPDIKGDWQSGGSVYRVTTNGSKVTGVFETVGSDGQALGFKAGDLSFEGTRKGNLIQGEHVIRYSAEVPCHKESGRRVPFMGMIAGDGKRIVIDWYNISLNAQNCQDVGRALGTTILERRDAPK